MNAAAPSGVTSSFRKGASRIDIRQAIAVRQKASRSRTLYYLSLFDDEIDPRFEEFLTYFERSNWTAGDLAAAALRLEPTDAVIIAPDMGEILVARGGACNFPLYWRIVGSSIIVCTGLPLTEERTLSVSGLLQSVAVVTAAYQNEPNLALRAPLEGWFRCRRAAVSRLSTDGGLQSEHPIDLADSPETLLSRDDLIQAIRSAFDKFGHRQRSHNRAVVELSGGMDSTLAAIAARTHGVELRGVSVGFPYYEFRFEEDIQNTVAQSLQIPRMRLEGAPLFSYAAPDWWPRLDEPATCIMAIKRDLEVARFAARQGCNRVLVGQAGDQIFSEHMLDPVPAPVPLSRNAFSRTGWGRIERARGVMRTAPRFLRRSTLTYLHDARLDLPLKQAVGVITRSPFCDIDIARCGWWWANLSARNGVIEGKRILADAFPSELPQVVRERRGKVAWDGICARIYKVNSDAILRELDAVSAPLEHIGLNLPWLIRRVGELARWERTNFGQDDREVFAAYAVATWMRSWGVERVVDAGWSD